MEINKLKELLKSKKLNQRELADKIGYTQTAISQAMSRGDFKISMLEKIANVLDVPISYFFSEGNNIKIKGHVHSGVGDIIKANEINSSDKELQLENKHLKEKIEGLQREIELLKEMNEILKNK